MSKRKEIEVINNELGYGDKKEIAKLSKISHDSVRNFFSGQRFAPDTEARIIKGALTVISRKKKEQEKLKLQIKKAIN